MITPGYAPTATERVLPRLALDFTTASLDARVTVTRALNTATRVNSSGLIETINANLPRFDYNPITKVCKGLLIEEARTQTTRGSDLISTWSKSNTTGVANVVASPSGAQDADLIYPSSSGNNRQVYIQSSTAPASGSVAISVFAADAGLNWLVIYGLDSTTPLAWFDVANGVKGTAASGWTSEIEPYENGFYRCSVVGTAVAGGYITFGVANADNSVAVTANGTNGLYFWGAQVEAGAFKTSYIPNPDATNGSSVTRNADAVQMTGTNFSSWYNATEGTFVSDIITNVIGGSTVAFSTGSFSEGMYCLATAGGNYFTVRAGNVTQTSLGSSAFIVGSNSVATGYKAASFATALNGNATNTTSSGNLPTVSTLTIGSLAGSLLLNGWAQKLFFYPQLLTQNEIRAFSKR